MRPVGGRQRRQSAEAAMRGGGRAQGAELRPVAEAAERGGGRTQRRQGAEVAGRVPVPGSAMRSAEGEYHRGMRLFTGDRCGRDYDAAARSFRLAAGRGHAQAQFTLAQCYMKGGMGVPQNHIEAAHLLRLAADQGFADAQCLLGFLCEHGKGTKRDLGEAVRLYRAAAAQRDVRALARLGVCLEKGRGVAQSEAEAAASYAAASELGGAAALFESGVQDNEAFGERSAPESFTLQLAVSELALAARLGHAGAVEKLASISSRREVVSACCLGCGATRELRLCSRCRVAAFCDGDCVRRMWPAHKPCCKQWQADAAATEE
mmetsp:Transcript_24712/g.58328  ORF Transcript_24712/g.58328 Transcript_24712/m.58328 type:complete len:320 (-) Transcript_24712:205-1164(-)